MKKQVFTLLLVMMSLFSSVVAWGQEPACKIGEMTFNTLQEALAYVNSYPEQEMTIIMLTDYTLPAGTYTLPANVTLLVPMNNEQEACIPIEELYISHNAAAPQNVWVKPTKFRSLTFADGVNMNVYGTIELSGKLHASSDDYTSSPYGPYGLLHMSEKAKMVLMNGAELRAWGFMTGTGETDARRGAKVREIFQMGDWKGGSISSMLLGSDKGVFPVTQYYIQNIESPVKYHPGAKLSTMAAVSASASSLSVTAKADVAIIGVSGTESMFLMDEEADQENTWVRKWYDTTNDQQVYEINSGAHIGSIVIDLGDMIGMDLKMNSSAFVLPLTNNMKIHLLSGLMDFTQNTALLPGAEVEINKESVVSITRNSDENVKSGALYIYDADQWGEYAYAKDGFKYTKVVRYTPSAPSVDGKPTVRNENQKPADASINVHGTFDTKDGYIFTSESGANIYSSNEDAGTFVLSTKPLAIGESAPVFQIYNDKGDTEEKQFVPAKLKNGDNTYTTTAGKSAGKTYCYMGDQWLSLMTVDCYAFELNEAKFAELMLGNATDFKEAFDVFIKPQAYEQIALQKLEVELIPDSIKGGGPLNQDMDDFTFFVSGNDDHTFSAADESGHLFILVEENCQWWQVEPVEGEAGLFHCELNNTYYYWDEENKEWAEMRYAITWKNGEDLIITYQLPRGAMAEYLGDNPIKQPDKGYTYTFTGWTPALAPVTENATYTAVYKSTPRKYTVTLKSDVEGACSFTGAGAYDYGTEDVAISATMNPGYKFVAWEHDETLSELSFTTTVTGDVTYTVRTEAVATPEVIRAVQEGYYYTICMPKAMTNVQGATFWQFVGRDANSAYIEPVATPTEAGKPYLMYATTTGDVTATLEGEAAITAGTNGALYGTFIDMDQAAFNTAGDNIYILIANVLRRVDGQSNNSLSAYRAYVDLDNLNPISGSMLTPNVRRVALGTNTATGVDQVQGDEVQSSKVLIDGTLYILRNGNMYDAQGKLIK